MNWQAVSDELSALLGDPDLVQYSDTLRKICWNKAQAFLAITHTASFRTATATGQAYADGVLVDYPTDFIELPRGGVQMFTNDEQFWIAPGAFEVGASVADYGYFQMSDGIYIPGDHPKVRLWYYGQFNQISDGSTLINAPAWAIWPLQNLSMAYMLYPEMMSQELLRQFQGKREAGGPDDNPPRTQAMFCIRLFNELIGRVKPQDRSLLFRSNG